jgi:L,D-transpeptidase ErfK/SrfK
MKLNMGSTLSTVFLLASTQVFAASYPLPPASESLIGQNHLIITGPNETVVTVAKQYDLGFNALENANPQLDMGRGFPNGSAVQLPTQHLLPNQPRRGIIVNLPEMRMYYYPAGTNEVLTYPIGIGKIGKTIPIKEAVITKKVKDPTWKPPQDIREFNMEQGIVLPRVMPAGPDNPLGPYAIYMTIPTYLIHSTIFPESVGKRASFGCIRMYQADIKTFFPSITEGIPIVISNAPAKVGWQDDRLFLEAHEPLDEHVGDFEASIPGMVHLITTQTQQEPTLVDWQLVAFIAKEKDGMPHEVGMKIK